jgi:O-antigen ligase
VLGLTIELVARPVVLGEDPGFLSDLSDTSSMGLTLLWYGLAVAWAIWQLMSRRRADSRSAEERQAEALRWHDWLGHTIAGCLFLIVIVMFVSAYKVAHNRFAARLVAWEWLGLFLAFSVVRRVASTPEIQQRLLAVLLAGAVASSVHGIYQAAVEHPRLRAEFTNVEKLRAELAKQQMNLNPDDPFVVAMARRIQENHISGTYAHPNSYAGYLALLIPGLIGAVYLAYRSRQGGVMAGAVICAALGMTALWLSHSRGALLAIVGVAIGLLLGSRAGRGWLWRHRLAAVVGVVVLAVGGVGASMAGLWSKGLGKDQGTAQLRLLYWRTTWRIIQEHPWLGVGPANFGNAYTQVMEDNADEKIKDPHNFALDLWVSAGVIAAAAAVTAFVLFFVRMVRSLRAAPAEGEPPLPEGRPWECYLGGILGLLLGFVLRVENADKETILSEAIAAGIRSVAWFAAFGLLEPLRWPARTRAVVLTAGVAALLLNLCVSGGIGFPAVAVFLWTAIALALNALPPAGTEAAASVARPAPIWPGAIAAPALVAITVLYLVYIFYPVTTAMSLRQQAMTHTQVYQRELGKITGPVARNPGAYLENQIIKPLEDARRLTPDDPRANLQFVPWYAEVWRWSLDPTLPRLIKPNDRPPEAKAVQAVKDAIELDPESPAGYLADYYLHMFFARQLDLKAQEYTERARMPKEAKNAGQLLEVARKYRDRERKEFGVAAEALVPCMQRDPTDLKIRYLRTEALALAGRHEDAARQARDALNYDDRLTRSQRRLSAEERQDLIYDIPEMAQPLRVAHMVLSASSGIAGIWLAWQPPATPP